MEDVPLLTVRVVNQGNTRRAVGVILDRCHATGNTDLVTTEIDPPISTLVPTTTMANGNTATVVPTATFTNRFQKGTFGTRTGNF
jgi:riboflavin biosynthesis pyrimidine reductase